MARVRVACTCCARGTRSETLVLLLLVVGAQCWPCRPTLCRCLWSMSAVTYTLWRCLPCCHGSQPCGLSGFHCAFEHVFEVNVLCFLAAANSCCYALAACWSVCILTLTLAPVIASLMKFIACSTSCAAVPTAYSPDSADDSATTAWVPLPTCIVAPSRVTVNPLVDFLVVRQPAQSASVYTLRSNVLMPCGVIVGGTVCL